MKQKHQSCQFFTIQISYKIQKFTDQQSAYFYFPQLPNQFHQQFRSNQMTTPSKI